MQDELDWLDGEIAMWEACLTRCKRAPKGAARRTVETACKDGLGRLRRMRAKLAARFDKAKDGAKPAAMEKLQDGRTAAKPAKLAAKPAQAFDDIDDDGSDELED